MAMNTRTTLQAAGFESLGNATSLYSSKQSDNKSTTSSKVPYMIILLPWGNAPLKAVLKYAEHYQTLYPEASILMLQTTFRELFWHTPSRNAELLTAAIDAIQSFVEGSGGKVLAHVFSNAGSYKLRELLACYKQRTGEVLPISAVVFDSSPGRPTLQRAVIGTQTQLPRTFVLYWLGSLIVFVVMGALRLLGAARGEKPILTQVWCDLNETGLLTMKAKRLYVYSKTDQLIDYKDVEDHAGIAKAKGIAAEVEEFQGSKHVSHLIADRERYWNVIEKLWDGGNAS